MAKSPGGKSFSSKIIRPPRKPSLGSLGTKKMTSR